MDEYGNKIEGVATWFEDGQSWVLNLQKPSGVTVYVGYVQPVGANWYWQIVVRPEGAATNGIVRSKAAAMRAVQRAAGITIWRAPKARPNPEVIRRSFGGRPYWLVSVAPTKRDADVAKATLIGTGHLVRTVRAGRSWRIFARQA